jgi:sec-independent protein translocase protein TatA
MFKSFGLPEIILILVIIIIFFGVGKLPQVGESIGKAIRSFKKSSAGEEDAPVTRAIKPKITTAKKA